MNQPFSVKLFLGYPLTPDLKHHLHLSHDWQQAKIEGVELVEVYHQGHDYLGQYVDHLLLTLIYLKVIESKIFDILERHKPGFNRNHAGCAIFPQLFIG